MAGKCGNSLLFIIIYAAIVKSTGQSVDVCKLQDEESPELFRFQISESDENGTVIGALPFEGIAGGDEPNISLRLEDGFPDSRFVAIDEELKVLTLIQEIDRDADPSLAQLNFEVVCVPLTGSDARELTYTIFVQVLDENDNVPQFVGAPYELSLSELTEPNTVVFTGIQATDKDAHRNGQIIYKVMQNPNDPESHNYFSFLRGGTPVLTLLQKLDYETKKSWEVLIGAMDNPQDNSDSNINVTTLTVTVLDDDDTGPFFLPCLFHENGTSCIEFSYMANVTEKMVLQEPLSFWPGRIHAMDGDEAVQNSQPIIFSFTDGEPPNYAEYFEIDSVSGNVTLIQPVRHSEINEFRITLVASEGSAPDALSSSIIVLITVNEINNNEPQFEVDTYYGFIQEGALVGSPVFASEHLDSPLSLHAIDPDLQEDEVFRVSYMLNDPSGTFILANTNESFAEIVTNAVIDRERVGFYTLKMVAMESSTTAQLVSQPVTITITVLDLNDNPPVFTRNEYSTAPSRYGTTIRQNVKAGTVIMELQVTDPDITPRISQYTYSLVLLSFYPDSSPTPFAEMSMNNTVKIVLLQDGTAVPRGDYVLSLQAADVDNPYLLSLEVFIDIKVIGENETEGPQFPQEDYVTFASEGESEGSLITTVTAQSLDNLPVLHSFVSDDDGFFTIDRESGEIRLAKQLDRETQQQHSVIVRADSGGKSATATVLINIVDVNDNSPSLNYSLPTVFLIVEGKPDLYVGQISAYDEDEEDTLNSEVWYSLDSEYFRINATNGVISTTKEVLNVDDLERIDVMVTLHDMGSPPRSADAVVVILVQDEADFSPVFEYPEYEVDIQENYRANKFLQLRGLDRDSADSLEFILLEGDDNVFRLDADTGALSLRRSLDFENKDFYYLEVVVLDANNNTDIANISVNVMDENDNAPQFSQSVYEGVYDPISPAGSIVVSNIMAHDADEQGSLNSQITYTLLASHGVFQLLNPSEAIIVTAEYLNFTQTVYMLTVLAADHGTPSLSNTADVIIRPRLIHPIFEENPIRVTDLFEGEPAESLVTQVKARANVGDVVTYSIISGNTDNVFMVRSINNIGFIYTTKELDRERQSLYILQVLAEIENPSRQQSRRKRAIDPSIAKVMIEVGDINDNPPIFMKEIYYAGVSLTATEGTLVTQIEASDMDVYGGQLEYSSNITSPTVSKFKILERTGVIVTTDSFSQSEAETTFRLRITAEDTSVDTLDVASTILLVSVINSTNRIIISVNMTTEDVIPSIKELETELSMLFSAHAFVEDVIQRRTGRDYQEIDPSGSDILIYVLEDFTGKPWINNSTLKTLTDRRNHLNGVFEKLLPEGRIVEVRKPVDVDFGLIVVPKSFAPEGILLLIIAIIIFMLTLLACVIILISWKKREMEREENRIYLPMQYSTFNPYKQSTEDLEISNPVFFEGHDNSSAHIEETNMAELFPNGTPSYLREKETQEYSIEFGPEDDEATAVANSVIQSAVLDPEQQDNDDHTVLTPSNMTDPRESYNNRSISQEPLIPPQSPNDPTGTFEEPDLPLPPPPDFSLPHVPEQPTRKAPSPPLRDYSNQGTLPADTVLPTYQAYDNPGMNLGDEDNESTREGEEAESKEEDDKLVEPRVPVTGSFDPSSPHGGHVAADDLHVALIRISQSEEDAKETHKPVSLSTFMQPPEDSISSTNTTPSKQSNYVHVVTASPYKSPGLSDTAGAEAELVLLSQDSDTQGSPKTNWQDYEELKEGSSSVDDWESEEDEVHSTKL
ncbi:Protocadherin-15 [Holothuria leucospilota]|uniref:Protocadherin-15 n=1 Tax=Holothuria leucospilota TaxID=206669 RepID=A0A9Q0YMJ4_HOLLE|nr:Protocadherin-15 [Holothuria leucospilota]